MQNTALLLIDIQNDFLPANEPGGYDGALAVPEGRAVISVANKLMDAYELVVATQDWHPSNHLSFASQHVDADIGEVVELDGLDQVLWPDHCIQGSYGAELASELDTAAIEFVVQKGTDRRIDSYSGFFDNARRQATSLEATLRSRSIDRIHVMGLATDYCVKFTVLDAIDLGFDTSLIRAGCRGVDLNDGDCQAAMNEMLAQGAKFI